MTDTLVLRVAGRPVARYATRPEPPSRLSPRPYLHPVTTLAGTAVTELTPADHTHHLGVGVAVPDVEGFNFWGGRTFVPDRGPTELDNHGTQRHLAFQLRDPDGFVEELRWTAAGTELLRERRTVSATELTDTAWAWEVPPWRDRRTARRHRRRRRAAWAGRGGRTGPQGGDPMTILACLRSADATTCGDCRTC